MADLQSLVDAAPPGAVIRLPAQEFRGPVVVAKPLTLEGGGKAILQGGGKGTVLTVRGHDVVVRGLRIIGSGESHDAIDAGIQVEGDSHRLEDNRIEAVLFGIHLRQATAVMVRGNSVRGLDRPLGLRGDAIRMWNTRTTTVADNRFERGRDITLINSPDNRLTGNHYGDGRYGMQLIFSPRTLIEGNQIRQTGTGIVVLYSPHVVVRGNRIAEALDGGGAGVVFKESAESVAEGNEIIHCATGLKADASPQQANGLTVRNNRFAHNIIGAFFYGDAGGHQITGNRFEHNLTSVAVSGAGAGSGNRWLGNYWDDYRGFDRNGDGIGDVPHEIWSYADRIWMETPKATFFRNSPALELLDFLEHLAPFSSPNLILRDPEPRVR